MGELVEVLELVVLVDSYPDGVATTSAPPASSHETHDVYTGGVLYQLLKSYHNREISQTCTARIIRQAYMQAVSTNPYYGQSYNKLADALLHLGMKENAAAFFTKAAELDALDHRDSFHLCHWPTKHGGKEKYKYKN